jgi:hypothetical protein
VHSGGFFSFLACDLMQLARSNDAVPDEKMVRQKASVWICPRLTEISESEGFFLEAEIALSTELSNHE